MRPAGLGGAFPGLTAELVAQGVPAGDLLANGRWYVSGHRLRQENIGLVSLSVSRPLLEGYVRARVRALPNVAFLDSRDILGLTATPDGRRVTGARVRRADGSAEELLGADLVVDATGRGSRTPIWLEALGYVRPETEQVLVGLGCAARTYRLPPDALDGDLALLDATTPDHPRGGALLRLDRFPDGLLEVGDAVGSFNPIYGQGMSVAALEALTLRRQLQRGAVPQPRRFFADLARVVDVPWDIAVGGDLAVPGVQGRRTLKIRLVNAYIARLRAGLHPPTGTVVSGNRDDRNGLAGAGPARQNGRHDR